MVHGLLRQTVQFTSSSLVFFDLSCLIAHLIVKRRPQRTHTRSCSQAWLFLWYVIHLFLILMTSIFSRTSTGESEYLIKSWPKNSSNEMNQFDGIFFLWIFSECYPGLWGSYDFNGLRNLYWKVFFFENFQKKFFFMNNLTYLISRVFWAWTF